MSINAGWRAQWMACLIVKASSGRAYQQSAQNVCIRVLRSYDWFFKTVSHSKSRETGYQGVIACIAIGMLFSAISTLTFIRNEERALSLLAIIVAGLWLSLLLWWQYTDNYHSNIHWYWALVFNFDVNLYPPNLPKPSITNQLGLYFVSAAAILQFVMRFAVIIRNTVDIFLLF